MNPCDICGQAADRAYVMRLDDEGMALTGFDQGAIGVFYRCAGHRGVDMPGGMVIGNYTADEVERLRRAVREGDRLVRRLDKYRPDAEAVRATVPAAESKVLRSL